MGRGGARGSRVPAAGLAVGCTRLPWWNCCCFACWGSPRCCWNADSRRGNGSGSICLCSLSNERCSFCLPPPLLDSVGYLCVRFLQRTFEQLSEQLHVCLILDTANEVKLPAAGWGCATILLLQGLSQHPQALELGFLLQSFKAGAVSTHELSDKIEPVGVGLPLKCTLRLRPRTCKVHGLCLMEVAGCEGFNASLCITVLSKSHIPLPGRLC
mmetsp:Transcript_133158/g.259248  ORF Transcript_133158/g.259248 Transcript_133158/m.259248 type:complete len:213 (+) Transcript_133158:621-1259(+)